MWDEIFQNLIGDCAGDDNIISYWRPSLISVEECARQCYLDSTCAGFTWNYNDLTCTLRNNSCNQAVGTCEGADCFWEKVDFKSKLSFFVV